MLDKFKPWKRASNTTETLSNPSSSFLDMLRGNNKSVADVSVTDAVALQHGAVYACVDRLSSGIASLPLHIYKANSKVKDKSFYLNRVLRNPNEWQTAFEFWQWMALSATFRGNAWAYIDRKNGFIQKLLPLHPDYVKVYTLDDKNTLYDGQFVFEYKPENQEAIYFTYKELLHIKGFPTTHPLIGASVISAQRDTIAIGIAGEEQAGKSFANGVGLSGIISVNVSKLSPEVSKTVRDAFIKTYGGQSKAKDVAVLGNDAKFMPITMTNQDAELLESRKYSRTNIAGIFNVPPSMIGDNEKSTFTNSEQQDLAWAKHGLRPWVIRFEQAIMRDLLTGNEGEKYYLKFSMDSLLRGDYKSRQEGMKLQMETSRLTVNEARDLDDLPPVDGGDVRYSPLNWRESGKDAKTDEKNQSIKNTISKAAEEIGSMLINSVKSWDKSGRVDIDDCINKAKAIYEDRLAPVLTLLGIECLDQLMNDINEQIKKIAESQDCYQTAKSTNGQFKTNLALNLLEQIK